MTPIQENGYGKAGLPVYLCSLAKFRGNQLRFKANLAFHNDSHESILVVLVEMGYLFHFSKLSKICERHSYEVSETCKTKTHIHVLWHYPSKVSAEPSD